MNNIIKKNNRPLEVSMIDTLHFEDNDIQVIDLATLKRTHKEVSVNGLPLKGIHHYELIEGVAKLCSKNNLRYEIEEIFAAGNKNKNFPGVVLMENYEKIYGEKAVEAHVLRRLFSTIRILDGEDTEITTTIALAFHQEGIQCAIGPCVRICHNQCILSADRIIATYGSNKVTITEMFMTIERWLNNFFTDRETDKRIIAQMKQIPMDLNGIYQLIGMLTSLRVMHDSAKRILYSQVKGYPLNQSQISQFTETICTRIVQQGIEGLTLWDIYNFATEIYKPGKTDIPNIINQNFSLIETITNYYDLG